MNSRLLPTLAILAVLGFMPAPATAASSPLVSDLPRPDVDKRYSQCMPIDSQYRARSTHRTVKTAIDAALLTSSRGVQQLYADYLTPGVASPLRHWLIDPEAEEEFREHASTINEYRTQVRLASQAVRDTAPVLSPPAAPTTTTVSALGVGTGLETKFDPAGSTGALKHLGGWCFSCSGVAVPGLACRVWEN